MPEVLQSAPARPASGEAPARSLFTLLTASTVYRRIAWIVLLFVLELVAISIWLDAATLSRANVLTRLMHNWGAWTLRAIVAFASLFLVFGYLHARSVVQEMGSRSISDPIRRAMLAGHLGSLAVFGLLARVLFAGSAPGVWTNAEAAGFIAAGLLAIVLGCLAFLPLALWSRLWRSAGYAWAHAGGTAILVCWLGNELRLLWEPATRVTFLIVKLLLTPFLAVIVSDPATATIGSPSFHVVIAPECSGLEGLGLMLAFGSVWLWLFRRDLRFPQAFVLVPASLMIAFLLNSVRIAALILIGNAGAAGIALGGFHSQAGWIAFNAVALGLAVSSQHLRWIARDRTASVAAGAPADNPSAYYLAPLVAILAAGMLSRALAGQFEWLYSLRLFAVAAVWWGYRKKYAGMDWKFDWLGPAAGIAVFALWIALDRWAVTTSASGTVPGLKPGYGMAWIAWLSLRTLGAVVAVPIAEELAFRGFLLRRMVSSDFDRLDYRQTSVLALLVSSVTFGLMHGARWFAGSVAGLVYALVLRRRGRIGEAVAAHATTNALLALWVISYGDWRLW